MTLSGVSIATIIIAAVLAALVVLVVVFLIKKGNSIGSGCHGCPNEPYCHRKSQNGCAKNPNHKKNIK